MKSRAEGVLSRIINEVIHECASEGEDVSETVAAYMIKAVVLNPDSEFLPDKPLKKEDVHRLITLCTNRLMDKDHPTVNTMKMQVAFELNHTEKKDFLEEHHHVMQTRLGPVTQEAIDAKGRTRDELEDVYRRITSAVLLQSGLGSPTNIEVVRETKAALQSIFPQTEVGTFLALSASLKRSQLVEFTRIVTGIRLFNKDCCRGGAGIDDLPYLLTQGIPMTLNTLQDELKQTRELAAIYTSLFLKICAIDPTPGSLSSANVTAAVAEEMGITLDLLRTAVVNARQYEAFLVILEQDLIEMTADVDRLCNGFNSQMKQLRDLIKSRQAVSGMEVYPGFMELSHIWNELQDEMVFLSVLTTTLSTIQSHFIGRRLKWQREKLMSLISDSEVLFDDQIKQHGPISEAERGNFTWIFPGTEANVNKLNVEFKGFCAWSLIKYQGLLVRSDFSLGCLLLPSDNRLYAFSSTEAARDFILAFDRMMSTLPGIVRRLPELIQFLKLGKNFSKGVTGLRDTQFIEKPYGQADAEMQTEVHPIESFIDKEYEWNEWELRKKALKLANLRRKATRSVQTILSNWRRDNVTQVYLLKNSGTSSKKDGYTQVPKPSVFQHGLRGCGGIEGAMNAETATADNMNWCTLHRQTNFTSVDLTIPVEQQLLTDSAEQKQ